MPESVMTAHVHVHRPVANEGASGVLGFFARVFDTDFVPRGECVSWRPEIVWTHVISDATIALAYYSIPLALLYFIRKRSDLAYRWMFAMFAAFILACGTTHVMSAIAFWRPYYRLDGVIKVLTGGVSLVTAVMLWPLIPRAAALPSPAQLRRVNESLEYEVGVRRQREDELRAAHAGMEQRVQERTAELGRLNGDLEAEIARRRAEERHKSFLLAELDHRVKNTLAMVLSLSEESLRASQSMDEFKAAFSGRLRALARTHAALAATKWAGISVDGLVWAAVEACNVPQTGHAGGRPRVHVEGPDVKLSAKAATTLCLTLNELVTNAFKYGAMSMGGGRVEIRWEIEAQESEDPPLFRMTWRESGGPMVTPPKRRGLGTMLIEDGASYELAGRVRMEYRPEGVQCVIEFPLSAQNTERGRFEAAASEGGVESDEHDDEAGSAQGDRG